MGTWRERIRTVLFLSSNLSYLKINPGMLFQLTISALIYLPPLIFCLTVCSYVQDIFTYMTHHWSLLKYWVSALPSIFISQYLENLGIFFLISRSSLLSCYLKIIFQICLLLFIGLDPAQKEKVFKILEKRIGRFVLIIMVLKQQGNFFFQQY